MLTSSCIGAGSRQSEGLCKWTSEHHISNERDRKAVYHSPHKQPTLSQWAELISSARSLKFCLLFSASPLTEICFCAQYHTSSGYSGSPTSHPFPRQKEWRKFIIYYGYLTLICAFYKYQNTSLRVYCVFFFMKCPPTLASCLNTWPPTSGTVWKDCGIFREWSLAGGSE